MTDNEIIKALECCKDLKCSECPKKANLFITDCDVKLCDEVLDLINRQKAEIERLHDLIKYQKQTIKDEQEKYRQCVDDLFGLADTVTEEVKQTKSEAINEFANKVEQKCLDRGIYPACVKRAIEEAKEEMTEQRKE